jgi:hypothetical protein
LNGAQRLKDLNDWNKSKVVQSGAAGTWQSEAAIATQNLPAELRLRLPGDFPAILWNARIAELE